ncbi:MAG: hypothetical protein ACXVLQ_18175 [Bacteriovorax sp.]
MKISIIVLALCTSFLSFAAEKKRAPSSEERVSIVSVGDSVPTIRVEALTLDDCERSLASTREKLKGKAKILSEEACASYTDDPERSIKLGNKPYMGKIIFY